MEQTNEYWTTRASNLEAKAFKETAEYTANLEKRYRKASLSIQKDINAWYTRYATENGISFNEAKRILTAGELDEFKWSVEEYIEKAKQGSTWAKQLERASARVHVTRLESLLLQIQNQVEVLNGWELDETAKFLERTFEGQYYQQVFNVFQGVGIGYSFAQLDTRKIAKALERPWAYPEANFSDRIWTNKGKLISTLDREITQMVIRGEKPDTVVKRVAKAMDTSMYNASRLVQTEEAHVSQLARAECYKELDIERTQVVATLDERTCATCGPMDRTVFKESDRMEGINCPPFHPWCRCTDAPYYDDMEIGMRTARGEDGKTYEVPADMSYEQWRNGLKADEDGQLMPKDSKPGSTLPSNFDSLSNSEKITALRNNKPTSNISKPGDDVKYTNGLEKSDELLETCGTRNCTEGELKSITEYTGTGYIDVNTMLYSDTWRRGDDFDFKHLVDQVTDIDSAISKTVLKDDLVVYRGVDQSILGESGWQGIKGRVLSSNGYSSTSLSERTALGYASKSRGMNREKILLEIRVPKGEGIGMYMKEASIYKSEEEFLLKRGSSFKVLERIHGNNANGKKYRPDRLIVELIE